MFKFNSAERAYSRRFLTLPSSAEEFTMLLEVYSNCLYSGLDATDAFETAFDWWEEQDGDQ